MLIKNKKNNKKKKLKFYKILIKFNKKIKNT